MSTRVGSCLTAEEEREGPREPQQQQQPTDGPGSSGVERRARRSSGGSSPPEECDEPRDADGSKVEAAADRVVEAPPPKVNPWTKRTTGRLPVNNNNNVHNNPQGPPEKREFFICL